jgi:hypothetical protein
LKRVLKGEILQTVPDVLTRMEDLLNDHNATSKRPMKLAMFLYAAEHISRACHILKQYRDAGVIVTFC